MSISTLLLSSNSKLMRLLSLRSSTMLKMTRSSSRSSSLHSVSRLPLLSLWLHLMISLKWDKARDQLDNSSISFLSSPSDLLREVSSTRDHLTCQCSALLVVTGLTITSLPAQTEIENGKWRTGVCLCDLSLVLNFLNFKAYRGDKNACVAPPHPTHLVSLSSLLILLCTSPDDTLSLWSA